MKFPMSFLLLVILAFMRGTCGEDDSSLVSYIMPSAVKSSLFSDCIDKKNTIYGTIHTVYLDEESRYELRVGDTEGYTWTEFELPDGASISDCALTAADEEALVFKYVEGKCSLATDPGKQGDYTGIVDSVSCGDSSTGDAVYICVGDYCPPPVTLACLELSEEGWRFGDQSAELLSDETWPGKATCCKATVGGHCISGVQATSARTACWAEAMCKHLQMQPLVPSLALNETLREILYDNFGYKFPLLPIRKFGDDWYTVPDNTTYDVDDFVGVPGADVDCATTDTEYADVLAFGCDNQFPECALCSEENSQLPLCSDGIALD